MLKLESMGMNIKKFDLPEIDHQNLQIRNSTHKEVTDELAIEIPQEDLDASSKLNEDQEIAYKVILDRVEWSFLC